MSTSQQVSSTTPNFQPILDKALEEYEKKTGKELTTHPLAEEIKGCSSPDAILAVLQGKANELNQSPSGDSRLTKWLTPTVNVLNALSATLGQGVGTVSPNVLPYHNCPNDNFQIFPPTQIIFAGINILLVVSLLSFAVWAIIIPSHPGGEGHGCEPRCAHRALRQNRELFYSAPDLYRSPSSSGDDECNGKGYGRGAVYTRYCNKGGEAKAIECVYIRRRASLTHIRLETFLKKLIGRKDIEDALLRLDKLEQGELRTVAAQVLKTTNDLKGVAEDLMDGTSPSISSSVAY